MSIWEKKTEYGIAADIGTSRIRLSLAELETKEVIGNVSVRNLQEAYGTDVLSRIEGGLKNDEVRQQLKETVLDSVREGIGLLEAQMRSAGPLQAEKTVIAGNTAMIYLLLGLDPSCIVKAPFVIPEHAWPHLDGSAVGHPQAGQIFLFPCPANYFGGDLVSGIYAADLAAEEDGTALFDIGINSELVIKMGDAFLGGSCAAGPAYEVRTEEDGVLPGSTAVSLMAELVEKEALNRRGRLQKGKDARITEYVSPLTGRPSAALRLADGGLVTQAAIGNLLQSKASTATMIEYMCETAEREPEDLKKLMITGDLGTNLDPAAAAAIGMLPALSEEKIVRVENASLRGAEKLLLAENAGAEEEKILALAEKIRYVQLREVEDYLEMMVPHLYL